MAASRTTTAELDERAEGASPPGKRGLVGTDDLPRGGPLWQPIAFLLTALILFALFGWTFVSNPDRLAPTRDPAFYTWRTEALLTEEPATVIETTGPLDMFGAGYRVSEPVFAAFLRHIPAISTLKVTVLMMAMIPPLTALLLAGFAYRQRRDPLLFHSVAFAAGGLYLTYPFVGYLDNVLCLLWLAAALWFIPDTRHSWPARIGFGLFLLLSGFTHTTTLAIFCVVLGAMAVGRLLFRRFDLRSVIRDDGPMLVTGFVAVALTLLAWSIGIWGASAPLTEAALPPPYGSDFFVTRMNSWIDSMNPLLNGPLLVIGIVGLLAAGRRAAEDELARVSIVWLAPLAGLFGFLAGLTYPYYRFFNTTLAWLLLVGVGAYFVSRFLVDFSRKGGAARIALVGAVAVAVILALNFTTGFDTQGWNDPNKGWLSPGEKADMDAVRAALAGQPEGRPVVFIMDAELPNPFQIWAFAKLNGNISRYGMPAGRIDDAYMYVGAFENYLAGEPTERGDETYDKLSPETLDDATAGIEASGHQPVVILASIFNPPGSANEEAARTTPDRLTVTAGLESAPEIWTVEGGTVVKADLTQVTAPPAEEPGALHIARAIGGLLLLLLPGALALRWFLRDAVFADTLGMVPALSMAMLTFAGIVVLAIVRSPFSAFWTWVTLALTLATGAVLFVRSRNAFR
jgi:hypothetical protein